MADIIGTESAETLNGTPGADTITGLGGDDSLYGYGGDDTLNGGNGTDWLYGGGGVDRLFGEGGDDVLILDGAITAATGTFGALTFDGGAGQDILLVRNTAIFDRTINPLYLASAPGGFVGI